MTESEVRKLLRQMKELDSQTAFRDFYNMTYDRLFRIAYYYVKQEEWSQEIVLDVFLKLWKQRSNLLDVRNIEDYCFILVKNASLAVRALWRRFNSLSVASSKVCIPMLRRLKGSEESISRYSCDKSSGLASRVIS